MILKNREKNKKMNNEKKNGELRTAKKNEEKIFSSERG